MDSDNKDNVPLSDDDQMPDGWNPTTNTWVVMPNDDRKYGWHSMTYKWVPQEDPYYSSWFPPENKWVHFLGDSDDEDEPDGFDSTTNTFVEKPNDRRKYGWRKTTNEWVPQVHPYYSDWNSEIGQWVHYQSFSDDESGSDNDNNPRDYQAEADDEEAEELKKEGLRRIGNRVIPI